MPRKKIEEITEETGMEEITANETGTDVSSDFPEVCIPVNPEATALNEAEDVIIYTPDKTPEMPEAEQVSADEPSQLAEFSTSDSFDGTTEDITRDDEPAVQEPTVGKPVSSRKKSIYDLNLNDLDRNLTDDERREWSAIYASFRAKSVLSGTVIGADQNTFDIRNRETGETEKKTLTSLIIIDYRVKVLIPESEMWIPGEERPEHVLRNMTGSQIDYVIMEIDREGQCAIGSRRMALMAKRHYFATVRGGHQVGETLKCRVLTAGAKRVNVECGGYDISLSQRDLSYTAIPDLREKYHPGQELTCKLKAYDREASRLVISVKEMTPNPFIGADVRHPVGSRRGAVISGKYAGGVFCTLPDDTVCLCLYSSQHSDMDFDIGDSVIIVIREYNYSKGLIFGRILSKWW